MDDTRQKGVVHFLNTLEFSTRQRIDAECYRLVYLFSFLLIAFTTQVTARVKTPNVANPYFTDYASHTVNNFPVFITSTGSLGTATEGLEQNPELYSGYISSAGCEYPKGSNLSLTYWGTFLFVGALKNNDTLVSSARTLYGEDGGEFRNDEPPFGFMTHKSVLNPDDINARSEEDWIAVFTDTVKNYQDAYIGYDWENHRRHMPLEIEVTQSSFAWSYEYAEDFVLVQFDIKNIGHETLRELYVGLCTNPQVKLFLGAAEDYDEVCGLLETFQSKSYSQYCEYRDTVNIAWSADNDGDPYNSNFTEGVISVPGGNTASVRHTLGVSLLSTIYPTGQVGSQAEQFSYNWSTTAIVFDDPDYGPRRRDGYRNFGTGGTGEPLGDKNKYSILSTPERDFPSIFTAQIGSGNSIWQPAPSGAMAGNVADGFSLFNYLSIGPYNLEPGASISIPVAIVAGENFHVDPNNGANLPNNPDEWMRNVDFSDLVKNTLWAQWIYDNPGVDTDGDGYFGSYHVCVIDSEFVDGQWIPSYADTIWYRGDGIPDWKGAGPPPAPTFKVTKLLNGLKVTFNGERSETEKDIFSRMVDFEGYRIYIARDDRATSYSRYASYDYQDYDIWAWNKHTNQYDLKDVPFSLDSLRCRYGFTCDDSAFDPLTYTSFNPYTHPSYPDSIYYFTKHDYNTSELGVSTPIKKVYPNIRDPRTVPADELTPDDYTEDGHLKFFEYECEITGLLSSVPYWVIVTAFDFGSPKTGLSPLETSVTLNAKQAYPASSAKEIDGNDLKVYVYPNPYRIDADYRDKGFEGRTRDDFPDDKVRQLNFANLPFKCTIRVYTLDGDMVVEKKHDADPSDPTGRHDYWSLINLNRQIIVSGLYYWTVEESDGTVQIGKFMVIR
jgi:hypothetical protein